MEKVLIIGGPGNISTTTIEELLKRNVQVAILTLAKDFNEELSKKVTFYLGERENIDLLNTAVGEFQPDVVLDFVCFTPDQAVQTTDVIYGKVKQYVFVSTVDIYGFPLSRLPIREFDPLSIQRGDYAINKKKCEDYFLSRYDRQKFPLTIARPAYSLGSFMISFLFFDANPMIQRIIAGEPIIVPGDGTTLIHVSAAANTGRMIARLAGHEKAIGKSYNCAHEHFMTHDEYVKLIGKIVGKEPDIVHLPTDVILSIANAELKNSFLANLSRYHLAFSVETFQNDFPDFKWETTLENAIKKYIDGVASNGGFIQAAQEIIDDRIIREWKKRIADFRI